MRTATFVLAILALGAVGPAAQGGAVKVTAARANVRAEASDAGAVVTQVVAGTILTLQAVEGDWFRIQLPPDARLPGVRVTAYISKKVATLVAAPPAEPAPAAPATARGGLSVALQIAGATDWLTPETVSVRTVDARFDPARVLAGVLPLDDASAAAGAAPVTFVWTLAGAGSPRIVTDLRPGLLASLEGAPGLGPDDVAPVVVRLTPTLSGVRVVAAIRARADQASRAERDWDVMKDLKQTVVRTTIEPLDRGLVRIVLPGNLDPGEYAVVFRPKGKTMSGAEVLAPADAAFGGAWSVSVRAK